MVHPRDSLATACLDGTRRAEKSESRCRGCGTNFVVLGRARSFPGDERCICWIACPRCRTEAALLSSRAEGGGYEVYSRVSFWLLRGTWCVPSSLRDRIARLLDERWARGRSRRALGVVLAVAADLLPLPLALAYIAFLRAL